jgi:hypothetical protein
MALAMSLSSAPDANRMDIFVPARLSAPQFVARVPEPQNPMTTSRYAAVYDAWKKDPEGFWDNVAKDIEWTKPYTKVFDPFVGQYGRWFVGGETNTAWNCLDRHVRDGRGEQLALIHDSPVTGTQRKFTYTQLTDEVATLGAVLQSLGIRKGDRVIIYMPMIPEALFAMLACARIGAIHSVVFGGFAAAELATRIDDCKPVAILAASCGIEGQRVVAYKPLLDKAIELGRGAWRKQSARTCAPSAFPLLRLIQSIFSTRPARPASRKASYATRAGTWWR